MPSVEAIYLAVAAGEPMRRVVEVAAIAGRGLEGDRYATGAGYYSRSFCQVTLIEAEALERMQAAFGVRMMAGEHRRNIVTRGLAHEELRGRRLAIGAVTVEYDRSRPPCGYLELLTEPRVTRAMGEGSGCGVLVLEGGVICEGDEIVLLPGRASRPARRLP